MQAQDRAHRFGQTKPVVVYRLVTAGSVESKIIDKANEKRKLEKLVLHKGLSIVLYSYMTAYMIGLGQFKGSKRYYENTTQLGITDLARAMADETERVSSTSSLNPEDILTNEDLERILDRSPEAYENAASQDHGKFKVVDAEDEEAIV